MKRWITVILASLLLSASGVHAAENETVRVGMSGLYFPFTFVKNDTLQGFEVDLWNEIGKRNGYRVKFVTANFSGLFGLLETGRIDTISNQITITDARKAKYLFSKPYVLDGAQIVVRSGNVAIRTPEDLAGKTVGVNLGSNYEHLLKELPFADKIRIRTYDSGIERDVALGRTDAFVMDRLSSAELIKKAGLPLQLAGEPFEKIENAWPFLKNERGERLRMEVDRALRGLRADGTLLAISVKWFGVDISK